MVINFAFILIVRLRHHDALVGAGLQEVLGPRHRVSDVRRVRSSSAQPTRRERTSCKDCLRNHRVSDMHSFLPLHLTVG